METKGKHELLSARYDIRGSQLTGYQVCDLFNLPEHVVVWRIMQNPDNKRGAKIESKMQRVVGYLGREYPAVMLGQQFKLDPQTIWTRWLRGERGSGLVERTDIQERHDPELKRAHQELECEAELRALVEHHRPMWRQNLIEAHKAQRARVRGLGDFCEAKAIRYAERLTQRGCRGDGTGSFYRSNADGIV